jgi:biopolymer transport protein ExbB
MSALRRALSGAGVRLACLAVAALLGSASARAGEAPAVERLRAALQQAQADLAGERKALEEDRARYESQEKKGRGRIEALLAERDDLLARIAAKEKDRARLQEESALLREARDRAELQETELRAFVREKTKALATKIELGVPHGSRAGRLAGALALAERCGVPEEDPSRLLGACFDAALDEVDLGASCEVFHAKVDTDEGLLVEADCMRLGKVFEAYRTKDGARTGLLVRGGSADGGWRWKESPAPARPLDAALRGAGGVALLPLDVTLDIPGEMLQPRKDPLGWFLSGGLVMFPLAAVALAALIVVLERSIVLAMARPRAARIEAEVIRRLLAGDADGAALACGRIPGPVARALEAGLGARAGGKAAVEEAIQAAALRALPRLERFLAGLSACVAVAPLLGLLGTVTGMIYTFNVITVYGTGDPRLLSGGISEALITTEVGLAIAIPGMLAHHLLLGRVDRTVSAIETLGAAMGNALFAKKEESK